MTCYTANRMYYVYVYVCMCMYVYVCVCRCMCMCMCTCMSTCMCMCTCTCVCVYMYVYVCVCVCVCVCVLEDFPTGSVVKNPLVMNEMKETHDQSLGQKDSPGGNGNPLHYSCQENPMDREAWWAIVHRVTKTQTWLSGWAATAVL